jgi:hypothetical protein
MYLTVLVNHYAFVAVKSVAVVFALIHGALLNQRVHLAAYVYTSHQQQHAIVLVAHTVQLKTDHQL